MRPIKNWFVIPGETWHNIWSWLSNVFEKCFLLQCVLSVCEDVGIGEVKEKSGEAGRLLPHILTGRIISNRLRCSEHIISNRFQNALRLHHQVCALILISQIFSPAILKMFRARIFGLYSTNSCYTSMQQPVSNSIDSVQLVPNYKNRLKAGQAQILLNQIRWWSRGYVLTIYL